MYEKKNLFLFMHLETERFSRQKDTSRDTGMQKNIFLSNQNFFFMAVFTVACKQNLIIVIILSVFQPFSI